ERQAKMRVTAKKEQAREQFDQQVAWRDGRLARAALSPKNQPAQYGHVVVERYQIPAMRTRGARRYHRLATRQPVDTHVQEAAKAQPKGEDRKCKKRFHVTRFHRAKCPVCLDLNDYKLLGRGLLSTKVTVLLLPASHCEQ